ncbi:MAG TPA: helicase-associated domain-containing protein [Mycobacteriales bacterium]|nr:helicase-associated domain-containing protein [Mycobacteriales bacterium]
MIDAEWLRGLGEEALAALLLRRPETIVPPRPVSLGELAERLVQPASVISALRRLDRPTLQVTEAVAALGGEPERAALDTLLGTADPLRSAAVERSLDTLRRHGLLHERDGRLCLVEPARHAWLGPLGLGPPAADLLTDTKADDLRVLTRNLGTTSANRKADMLAAVLAVLRDAPRIRLLARAAPPVTQEILLRVAETGELVEDHTHFSLPYGRPSTPLHWAAERGLLLRAGEWSGQWQMPAEVALALRGEGYTAPFEPEPPPVRRTPVDTAAIERDCAAAGSAMMRHVAAILDEAGRTPVPLLKAGGVGVRELRRLGKRLGCPTGEVRMALAVASRAGLLGLSEGGAVPLEEYDEWLRAEPGERLAELIRAWWKLPYAPLAAAEEAWEPADLGIGVEDLRCRLVAEVAAEPGSAPTQPAELVARVLWRQPYLYRGPDPTDAGTACLAEAGLLGVLGAGAVSPAGRALLAGGEGLADALAGTGSLQATVRLQADLTALVAGTPTAELADLLDLVADRETAGVAWTWRFGPASVRRAFDAGQDADGLLARLDAAAVGSVPQPLAYLIRDVARRHGAVRGREVACVLRCDDGRLLAEIAADRRLLPLGLHAVAPTVLTGVRPLAETVAALRAAGYAPLAEQPDGTPIVESAGRHRIAAPRRRTRPAPRRTEADRASPDELGALARTLLDQPDTVLAVADSGGSTTLAVIRTYARHLVDVECRILAHAVEHGGPVTIDYVNQNGAHSRRVVEGATLSGTTLFAWCQLRQDDRMFSLGRIRAVSAGAAS